MNPDKKELINHQHPDDEILGSVAEGTTSPWIRDHVLQHIEDCESCRFVLMELARYADSIPDLEQSEEISEPLKLAILDGNSDQDQNTDDIKRERIQWRRPGDTFYFWIAGSFFFASFIVSENYNWQFLVAAAFFGLLSAIDYSHRNIFSPLIEAWREGDDEKAKEAIEQLRERFKIS